MTNDQLLTFTRQTPKIIVESLAFYNIGGDAIMGDKKNKIGNLTGNSFGNNTSIQSEEVFQTNVEQSPKVQSALIELRKEIEAIQKEEERETAFMYYEMLQKSVEENKTSRIERCLKSIKNLVGVTTTLIKIATFFGLTL